MKKDPFIWKIRATYAEFRSLVDLLTPEQSVQRRTCGEWSVKDVIAHITWYEREMISLLRDRALVGSDLWNLSLDERNSIINSENSTRDLKVILHECDITHESMMKYLFELTDEDLTHPDRFKEMPGDWMPWQLIASNTFEHYPDHLGDIRRLISPTELDSHEQPG